MTADQYVASILAKYQVEQGPSSPAERLGTVVAMPIRSWAGQFLAGLQYSGSYAKGTGVRGITDVDIFMSLRSDTPETLKGIYQSLHGLAARQGWSPRKQNVSVGITLQGVRADLVPGKIQEGYQHYHSLYRQKADSWTQTNVALHINTVTASGRIAEIRAVKIWKFLRSLNFPSLYLELFVINALSGRPRHTLAENVLHVLRVIGDSLESTRIEDPANTNNIVSEDVTGIEKRRIAQLAAQSAREHSWTSIIW